MAEEIKEEIKEEVATEETENETENVADSATPVDDAEPDQELEIPVYPTAEITLADGTAFNVKVNGDNLISEEDVIAILTPVNLADVKVDGSDIGIMKLGGYRQYPDGYHFVLLPKSKSEIEMDKLSAKLEYIAIMTDVEVE